jgi:hypothetical protein
MELVDRLIIHFLHARTAAGASSLLRLKGRGTPTDVSTEHYGIRSRLSIGLGHFRYLIRFFLLSLVRGLQA